MNLREAFRTAMKLLLLASLVAINALPFWTNTSNSYEVIFLVLSGIHAELCLFSAWGIFVSRCRRNGRWVWCLLGLTAAVVAATRLIMGGSMDSRPWQSVLLGLAATLPALLPMLAVFVTQKLCTGITIAFDASEDQLWKRFHLRQLFTIIAGCAFLSALLRQVIQHPDGWLVSSTDASAGLLAGIQSFMIGMLAAPCALVILRPNRFSLLWLPYVVLLMAAQPILEPWFCAQFQRPTVPGANEWIWPDAYLSVVLDNFTWYGPQLLPTVVLFVMLRLSGARIEETKAGVRPDVMAPGP